jgi:endonuclease/exonuclease/phosphatase family metal-dependent hydrolase
MRNIDGLSAAVREYGPFDALAIQEGYGDDRLEQFAAALDMRVGIACKADFGLINALLVPQKIVERQIPSRPAYAPPHQRVRNTPGVDATCALTDEVDHAPEPEPAPPTMTLEPKAMSWKLDDGEMEVRAACALSLSWHGAGRCCLPLTTVVCTHLGAYQESTRLTQLRQLRSLLATSLRKADETQQEPMFLLGDFNALRRRDYSNEEWEALCEKRAKATIKSETAVTDTLEAGPTVEEAGPWGLTDCATAAAGNRTGPTASSVYGARVDYIWANHAAMQLWQVIRYVHVELPCEEGAQALTDHALVICELELR